MNQPASIAITGIACRFPGAPTYRQFREQFRREHSFIGELPKERQALLGKDRQTAVLHAGYLKNILTFDYKFFGISEKAASKLAPLTCMLQEEGYRCIENALLNLQTFRQYRSALFLAIRPLPNKPLREELSDFSALTFGTQYLEVEASFHDSLRNAARALKSGQLDYALVAGAHLAPRIGNTHYFKGSDPLYQALSPNQPGEGLALLLLETQAQATGRHTHIHAQIQASYRCAVNELQITKLPTFDLLDTGFVQASPTTLKALEHLRTSFPQPEPFRSYPLERMFGQALAASEAASMLRATAYLQEQKRPQSALGIASLDHDFKLSVLSAAPDPSPRQAKTPTFHFLLSGHTKEALLKRYEIWRSFVRTPEFKREPELALFQNTLNRETQAYRWGATLGDKAELKALLQREKPSSLAHVSKPLPLPLRLGSAANLNWPAFKAFFQADPFLKNAFNRCRILLAELGVPQKKWLHAGSGLLQFSVLYALGSRLIGSGFKPSLITGEGLGYWAALALSEFATLKTILSILAMPQKDHLLAFEQGSIPFYDPLRTATVFPTTLDVPYLKSMLVFAELDGRNFDVIHNFVIRLRQRHPVFEEELLNWNAALDPLGLNVDRLIRSGCFADPEKPLCALWLLILEICFQRTRQASPLRQINATQANALAEFAHLISNTLSKTEIVQLFTDPNLDDFVTLMNARLPSVAPMLRAPLLKKRFTALDDLKVTPNFIKSTRTTALPSKLSDFEKEVLLGDSKNEPAHLLKFELDRDLLNSFHTVLLSLWLKGHHLQQPNLHQTSPTVVLEYPFKQGSTAPRRVSNASLPPSRPLKPTGEPAPATSSNAPFLLREPIWNPAPLQLQPAAPRNELHLVFSDGSDLVNDLIETLKNSGKHCLTLNQNASFKKQDKNRISLDFGEPRHYQSLRSYLQAQEHIERIHAYYFAKPQAVRSSAEENKTNVYRSLIPLFLFCKAVNDLPFPLILLTITRNHHAVRPEEKITTFFCGGLYALGRTASMENKHIHFKSLDLETRPEHIQVHQILDETLAPDVHVAYRDKHRYRLEFGPLSAQTHQLELTSTGVCVILGGTGSLGLHIAHTLSKKHKLTFALLGRSPSSDAILTELECLQTTGNRATYYSCDITDAQRLTQTIQDIRSTLGPIRSVFHAADSRSGRTIGDQSVPSFLKGLEPKVLSTLLLHELTQSDPLELFALMSCESAYTGYKEHAGYAAASGFLNSFAMYRTHQASPGRTLALNWPIRPFGDTKKPTRNPQKGFALFDPHFDGEVLTLCLAQTSPHILISSFPKLQAESHTPPVQARSGSSQDTKAEPQEPSSPTPTRRAAPPLDLAPVEDMGGPPWLLQQQTQESNAGHAPFRKTQEPSSHPLIGYLSANLRGILFNMPQKAVDHQKNRFFVDNLATFPYSLFIELARAAGQLSAEQGEVTSIRQMQWPVPFLIDTQESDLTCLVHLLNNQIHFEIAQDHSSQVYAMGYLHFEETPSPTPIPTWHHDNLLDCEFYQRLEKKGLKYAKQAQCLQKIQVTPDKAIAELLTKPWPEGRRTWPTYSMEALFQLALSLINDTHTYLPASAETISILDPAALPHMALAKRITNQGLFIHFDLALLDAQQEPILEIKDLCMKRISQIGEDGSKVIHHDFATHHTLDWGEEKAPQIHNPPEKGQPLLQAVSAPSPWFNFKEERCQKIFDFSTISFPKYQLRDSPLMPPSLLLELARNVKTIQPQAQTLLDFVWPALILLEEMEPLFELAVLPRGETAAFEFYNSTCLFGSAKLSSQLDPPIPIDAQTTRHTCLKNLTKFQIYAFFRESGFHCPDSLALINELHLSENEALATLVQPKHPSKDPVLQSGAVTEAALQTLQAFLGWEDDQELFYFPAFLGKATYLRSLAKASSVHLQVRTKEAGERSAMLTILDASDEVLVQFQDVRCLPISSEALGYEHRITDWLPVHNLTPPHPSFTELLVIDPKQKHAWLQPFDHQLTMPVPTSQSPCFPIAFSNPSFFVDVMEQIPTPSFILFLADPSPLEDPGELLAQMKLLYNLSLSLGFSSSPPLTLLYLTRSEESMLAQAAVLLARALAKTPLSLKVVRGEIDTLKPLTTISQQPGQSFRVQDHKILVEQSRVLLKKSHHQPTLLRKGGTYLMVNGLNQSGYLVGLHLAEHYSAHLVIFAHEVLDHQKLQQINELEKRGAQVLYVQGILVQEDLQRLFERIYERFGPLSGILHFFSDQFLPHHRSLQDNPTDNQLMDDLTAIQDLDRESAELALDFFLVFSKHEPYLPFESALLNGILSSLIQRRQTLAHQGHRRGSSHLVLADAPSLQEGPSATCFSRLPTRTQRAQARLAGFLTVMETGEHLLETSCQPQLREAKTPLPRPSSSQTPLSGTASPPEQAEKELELHQGKDEILAILRRLKAGQLSLEEAASLIPIDDND